MNVEEIRLECLKLAHRHDLDPERVVERAGQFERYIQGTSSQPVERKPGRPPKAMNPLG